MQLLIIYIYLQLNANVIVAKSESRIDFIKKKQPGIAIQCAK